MIAADGMTDVERLIELQAIYRLKGRRDHAVDRKDWGTYAELHTDDYVAMSISSEPIVGGSSAAQALSVQLANVIIVHHCHTPPGASIMAKDISGENILVGVAG